MKIEFTFPGEPVPYVRMNHQNIWTVAVQNYLAYKGYFSQALAAQFPEFVIFPPPTSLKKERAAFMKEHKKDRYKLDFTVYESRERGDWDNYGKVVGDALQDAGLVVNDKKIKTGSWRIEIDGENPRIEFTLERIA